MKLHPSVLKLFALPGTIVFLFGCVSPEATIRVYNDTEKPVSKVNLTWGNGSNRTQCSFDQILPGKNVRFTIQTNSSHIEKSRAVCVDMDYVWEGTKYEYPDMISCLSYGDTGSHDFRIRGKTAVSILRSLFGPPPPIESGIVRKAPQEEQKILEKHKGAWKESDRMEVQNFRMEKIPKKDGSYPDWKWVQKESDPIILSDSDRKKVLDFLDTLSIPERSDLDSRTSKPYVIRIYRKNQLTDTLTLTGFDGILGVPEINTALHFPSHGKCSRSDCWKLLQKLFSERIASAKNE